MRKRKQEDRVMMQDSSEDESDNLIRKIRKKTKKGEQLNPY